MILDPSLSQSGRQSINGHGIHWEVHGSDTGNDVVMLHHGLGSTQSWKRQIPALIANGYRTILHDRWGYGRSDARQEFASRFLHADAEETVSLLQILGIKKASFIGHSDGGSIAIIIASRYPDLVDKLILIAAHIYIEPKMSRGLKAIQFASNSSPLKDVLLQEHGSRYSALVKAWIACWKKHGELTLDLQSELDSVNCPTLVIQGMEDEHAHPKHAEDIAQGISDSKLWLIPEVGHMPPHVIPDRFNQQVIGFLSEEERMLVPDE